MLTVDILDTSHTPYFEVKKRKRKLIRYKDELSSRYHREPEYTLAKST